MFGILAVARQIVIHTTVENSDLATTILAGVGTALAVISLGWQAVSFWLTGARVSVALRAGATDGVRIITTVGVPTEDQRRSLASQGMSQAIFAVEVINSGRGPTSVQSVDLLFSGGAVLTGSYLRGSPELPYRMEGQSEKTWIFEAGQADDVARGLKQTTNLGPVISLRGQVKLGGRKKPVVSNNEIRVL